ncbi:MAG: DNA polymerase sliding clamp [Thermoprotei archaeon]|nr:MAG: DNA polymerase sliding clamp [Thermoprotei archaeon]
MVDLELPSIVFEEYECDQETRVGVDIEELNKILKRGRADERIEFDVEGGRLRIKIIGKATRTFSLPLIDVVGEELGPLKVTFNVKAKLLSDTLKDAMRDIEQISDSVKFNAEEDSFTLRASSDKGEVEIVFDRESGALIEYEVTESSVATYSTSYLSDMLKRASALSDVASVEFSSNKPLALTFEIAGGGRLAYYLAPRTE